MVNNCINKNTTFYKTLQTLNLSPEQIAQITDKLTQEKFIAWYGKGEKDSFDQPRLVDGIYIINDKGVKISIRDLLNDSFYTKRQNYRKDITITDKIQEFLDGTVIALTKRISAYGSTAYSPEQVLNYLKTVKDTDNVKALVAYYEYMRKTTEDFELRFKKFDTKKGTKESKANDVEFKEFLRHAGVFLQSFGTVKNLETPITNTSEEKEIIQKLKSLEPQINDLQKRVEEEIEDVTRDILDKYISNPEVRAGVIDFLAAQADEGIIQHYLDAMGDSHNTFIAAIDKFSKKSDYDKKIEAKNQKREWKEIVDSYGGPENFRTKLERILEKKDGKKTGRFIQKYNEDFYTKLFEYTNKLRELEDKGLQNTTQYTNLLDEYFKWRSENIEQKYVKEYYEALNKLTPEARKAKEEIDNRKNEILERSSDNPSIEELEMLADLEEEFRWLKSTINPDGTPKTGKSLQIAKSLFQYNKSLAKFYEQVGIKEEKFEQARKRAEEKGEFYYERWLARNTKESPTDEFWKFFNDIIKEFPDSKALQQVNDEINQLIVGYKNEKGEIKVEEIPADIRKKYDELMSKKASIKEALNNTIPPGSLAKLRQRFKALVKFEPTSMYFKAKEKALAKGAEEYRRWMNDNHELDFYTGELIPNSIWTKMVPRSQKFIERKPSSRWTTSRIKPEYFNKNHKLDDSGYAVPTNKWINSEYKNLSEEDLNLLNTIMYGNDKFKGLIYFVNHTKADYIKRGGLPAIPLDVDKKKNTYEDSEKMIIVDENDEIVKFIPLNYVKRITTNATIKPIPDGATEEEIKKIEEENESEKRKAHAETLDFHLDSTMNRFIDAALTHKYKKAIETDLLLFKEQFKNQKVLVTTAQGDKLFDKIKSTIKGDKVQHEESAIGSNVYKRYTEWLDSVFYEDFEKDEGWLNKAVSPLVDLTSLRALGFNVLSATNNKLIGNIQARIEAAGSIYFDYSDYRKARWQYGTNIQHFIANHKTPESKNFIDAFLKGFDVVVSQDELSNRSEGKLKTFLHKAKAIKDTAYFLMHIGEHQVQNTALLAMANSHRIVNGKIVNFTEFARERSEKISYSKNMTKEELEEQVKNIDTNKALLKELQQEFENYTKVFDAYTLVDGNIKLKDDIKLDEMEEFNFQQRVIGINQRLHGIYVTEDAGLIQRYALGRLGMQFRKWIRPSWNRRFGRRFGQTDYNERIRDWEEGMYISTAKYLFGPAKENWKAFAKDEQKTALKAFKMIVNSMLDVFRNAKVRWHSMTEVQKSNVKKTAAEFTFLIATILLGLLIKGMKGDDEDEDEKALIVALYQTDRIFGELTTFTPVGVVREGNRLFDSPLAVFRTLDDLGKLAISLFLYPFRDEDERKFKTGIYYGADKVGIHLGDILPVYNQFQRLEYMNESNNRYGMLRKNGLIMQLVE